MVQTSVGDATVSPTPGIDPSAARAAVIDRSRAVAAARRRREEGFRWFVRLLSLAVVLGVWELYGRSVNKALFAPPSAVVSAGFEMTRSGELWSYLRGSLVVLAYGFGIALVLGIPLGVAIARSRIVDYALNWYVDAFNSTPNPFAPASASSGLTWSSHRRCPTSRPASAWRWDERWWAWSWPSSSPRSQASAT